MSTTTTGTDAASSAGPTAGTSNAALMESMPDRCRATLTRAPALQQFCLIEKSYERIRACGTSIESALLAAELYRDRACLGERSRAGAAQGGVVSPLLEGYSLLTWSDHSTG